MNAILASIDAADPSGGSSTPLSIGYFNSPATRRLRGIVDNGLAGIGHAILDFAGMMPNGLGVLADGINAAWYAAEGDWKSAARSVAFMGIVGAAPIVYKAAKRVFTAGDVARGTAATAATPKALSAVTQPAQIVARGGRIGDGLAPTGRLGDTVSEFAGPSGRGFSSAQKEIGSGPLRLLHETESAAPPTRLGLADEAMAPSRRLPQDIAVDPRAPRRLDTDRPIGVSPTQNNFVQARVADLGAQGARDIRINQQQVDAFGARVGINRPDLQFTLHGQRYYEEFDRYSSFRGLEHQARLYANDPYGIVDLIWVD